MLRKVRLGEWKEDLRGLVPLDWWSWLWCAHCAPTPFSKSYRKWKGEALEYQCRPVVCGNHQCSWHLHNPRISSDLAWAVIWLVNDHLQVSKNTGKKLSIIFKHGTSIYSKKLGARILDYLQATIFKYRFFCLFSGCWECSDANSSWTDADWMSSYSLENPMSPSACSSLTCLGKIWAGMARFSSSVESPSQPVPPSSGGIRGGSSK